MNHPCGCLAPLASCRLYCGRRGFMEAGGSCSDEFRLRRAGPSKCGSLPPLGKGSAMTVGPGDSPFRPAGAIDRFPIPPPDFVDFIAVQVAIVLTGHHKTFSLVQNHGRRVQLVLENKVPFQPITFQDSYERKQIMRRDAFVLVTGMGPACQLCVKADLSGQGIVVNIGQESNGRNTRQSVMIIDDAENCSAPCPQSNRIAFGVSNVAAKIRKAPNRSYLTFLLSLRRIRRGKNGEQQKGGNQFVSWTQLTRSHAPTVLLISPAAQAHRLIGSGSIPGPSCLWVFSSISANLVTLR